MTITDSVDDVSADKRTSISVDCRTLDANDPAAIEARADNDDYDDHPTAAPPQPPPSPLVPPPASADLDVRSRDAAGNVRTSADDERGRRQEAGSDEMDLDPVMRDDVDLWARTTVKPAPESVEDADSHCEYRLWAYFAASNWRALARAHSSTTMSLPASSRCDGPNASPNCNLPSPNI